jgi:hypothetical protein
MNGKQLLHRLDRQRKQAATEIKCDNCGVSQ